MTRRTVGFFVTLALTLLVAPFAAAAQQAVKIPRIGFLSLASPSDSETPRRLEAFRQGLRELGYVEGQNIMVEYRFAEWQEERFAAFAAELVRLPVDVLVTRSAPAAHAARHASLGGCPIAVPGLGRPAGPLRSHIDGCHQRMRASQLAGRLHIT